MFIFIYIFLLLQLLSSERNDWSKEREELLEQIKLLEKQFQDAQSKADSKSVEHWNSKWSFEVVFMLMNQQ